MYHCRSMVRLAEKLVVLLSFLISSCSILNNQRTEADAVTITFAAYDHERTFFQTIIDEFNQQHEGIEVRFVSRPEIYGSAYELTPEAILRRLASTADTFLYSRAKDFDTAGILLDVQPLTQSDLAFPTSDYWAGSLNACMDAFGNMAGLPAYHRFYGIFYDESAFNAAGIPTPTPDWTWEDFQRLTATLAVKPGGQDNPGFLDYPSLSESILAPLVIKHIEQGLSRLDREGFREDIQWYFDQVETKTITSPGEVEPWILEMEKVFSADAGPAMWVDNISSRIPAGVNVREIPVDGSQGVLMIDKFGFVPFPKEIGRTDTGSTPASSTCLAISGGSQEVSAAWTWLKFLSEKWLVHDRGQVGNIPPAPARRLVAEREGYFDYLPAKSRDAAHIALENLIFSDAYSQEMQAIEVAFQSVLSGQTSLEEAIAAVRDEFTRPAGEVDTDPITVATSQPTLPAETVEINFFAQFFYSRNQERALHELAGMYNQANQGTLVRISDAVDGDPGKDNWTSMAEKFDCFYWHEPWWDQDPPVPDPGIFLDLGPFIASEPATFLDDFYPGTLGLYSLEGTIYGLPAISEPNVIAYNADLLRLAGFNPPANDWTFDELMEMALVVASGRENTYGFNYAGYGLGLLYSGRGISWQGFQDDPLNYFNSPAMAAFLSWLKEMIAEGALVPPEVDGMDELNLLRSGKVAFWVTKAGTNGLSLSADDPYQASFEVGFAPIPAMLAGSELVRRAPTMGLFISKSTPEARACWDWIKYFSENAHVLNGIPARRSVAESSNWAARLGADEVEVYRITMEQLTPYERWPSRSILNRPLYAWHGDAVSSVLEGADIVTTLMTAHQKAETYLACIGPAKEAELSLSAEELSSEASRCATVSDPSRDW
jgi:ABC-type glycerol-3-phosphate transport system substrate-binding protein